MDVHDLFLSCRKGDITRVKYAIFDVLGPPPPLLWPQVFSIQKVARPSGTNLQLAAETCELAQVPSLSMGARGTLMDRNLTFIN